MIKRPYIKPHIERIALDNLITLQMQTQQPTDPPPRSGASPSSEPFQSPFDSKPFG